MFPVTFPLKIWRIWHWLWLNWARPSIRFWQHLQWKFDGTRGHLWTRVLHDWKHQQPQCLERSYLCSLSGTFLPHKEGLWVGERKTERGRRPFNRIIFLGGKPLNTVFPCFCMPHHPIHHICFEAGKVECGHGCGHGAALSTHPVLLTAATNTDAKLQLCSHQTVEKKSCTRLVLSQAIWEWWFILQSGHRSRSRVPLLKQTGLCGPSFLSLKRKTKAPEFPARLWPLDIKCQQTSFQNKTLRKTLKAIWNGTPELLRRKANFCRLLQISNHQVWICNFEYVDSNCLWRLHMPRRGNCWHENIIFIPRGPFYLSKDFQIVKGMKRTKVGHISQWDDKRKFMVMASWRVKCGADWGPSKIRSRHYPILASVHHYQVDLTGLIMISFRTSETNGKIGKICISVSARHSGLLGGINSFRFQDLWFWSHPGFFLIMAQ